MTSPISNQPILERSNSRTPFRSAHYLLYYIGTRIIRYNKRTLRHTRKAFMRFYWFSKLKLSDTLDLQHTPLGIRFQRTFVAPFSQTADNLHRYIEYRRDPEYAVMEHGQVTVKPPMTKLFPVFEPLRDFAWRGFHYLLPLAGIAVLATAMIYFADMDYALKVTYNDEYVGYIQDENDFELAEKKVLERTIASDASAPSSFSPIYSFEMIHPEQITPPDLLVNNLVQASGNEIQEATGVYVDGNFVGAVENGEDLLLDLKNMKDIERSNAEENAKVSFVQDLKLQKGLFPITSLVSLDSLDQKFNSEVSGAIIYTVKKGDSPYTIANDFNVPMQTIYNLNPEATASMLVGTELTIAKPMPFLQKKVVKTITEQTEIPFEIEIQEDKNKNTDYKETIQNGRVGINKIVSEVTFIGGAEAERNIISESTIMQPVAEKVVIGTLKASNYSFSSSSAVPAPSGKVDTSASGGTNVGGYIWPVSTANVICPIWGYSGHTGTDIGAPAGTPIWAAKAGTVSYSGWSRGYGYNVLITHSDGTKTRYAHCSALGVSAGQTVLQGQAIANVGRTGNATCNHCHFEIISNGKYIDARNAIG